MSNKKTIRRIVFVHRAGFELGTGLSINVVDPTRAAEEFRKGYMKE